MHLVVVFNGLYEFPWQSERKYLSILELKFDKEYTFATVNHLNLP